MTTRTTATIAAGMLAIGIVVGAAGAFAANEGPTNGEAGVMGTAAGMNAGTMGAAGMNASSMGAGSMMSTMGAGSMADMARMMSTMGAGSMADMARMMSTMGAGNSTSPDPTALPEDHELHHSSPSPSAT